MNTIQAIKERHSVRAYTDKKIEGKVLEDLVESIEHCKEESKLNIQLCTDEEDGFSGMMAMFGRFSNVKNYIAFIGEENEDIEEKIGYYGEKIVLRAQELGLNTCWVGLTYNKKKSKNALVIKDNEKVFIVISIGYGKTQGSPRKTKPLEKISNIADLKGDVPTWFIEGLKAAQLAPTAINQQKFYFELREDKLDVKALSGPYSKLDLGIVKYHFELGSGIKFWSF